MEVENFESDREIKPHIPTFYIFKGVSGAGCSTAIDKMCELNLMKLSPPEFTTRPLRPGEKWGHRHYSITKGQLDLVRRQIAVLELVYGNEYGFFKPAIKKIRKTLGEYNVVVDSATPPDEWKSVLGENLNITSLFFAPHNPLTAVERILGRANEQKDDKVQEYLIRRAEDNSKIIKGILDFDFWIDTTNLSTIFPTVQTFIETTSYQYVTTGQMPINIAYSREHIEKLIEDYQNPEIIRYAHELLNH